MSVQSEFQVAPRNSGLKTTIISVGELTDQGSEVELHSDGGSIVNIESGRRIDFQRKDGVYVLNASKRPRAEPDRDLETLAVTIQ